MNFYHITTIETWEKFSQHNFIEADSLHTEGFIHCSYTEQLEETLNLYFNGVEKVIILEIDPSLLLAGWIAEPSRNGLLFPHIYGVINKSAIIKVVEKVL